MGRKRHAFKENDAARAVRAARKGGIEHPVLEIDPSTGKITVRSGAPPPSQQPDQNEWEDVLRKEPK